MRISNYMHPYSYRPVFNGYKRAVYDDNGNLLYRNDTQFFRFDLDWDLFGCYLKNKYKRADKVNVFCYGCSNGAEPMSLAMLLKEQYPKTCDKYFPIEAKDIDSEIISIAKSQTKSIPHEDYSAIEKFTKSKFDKYFHKLDDATGAVYEIDNSLSSCINYSIADINKDIMKVPSKNSVVFCRNIWPYLKNNSDCAALARLMANTLKENCTVVVGDFDKAANVGEYLMQAGFRKVQDLPNVYETPPKLFWFL